MTAHELLVAARNVIDKHGWTRGSFGHSGIGYCAAGSMARVGARHEEYVEARAELCHAAGCRNDGALYDWNDTPGRTKEEVLAAFDKAIAATAPEPAVPSLEVPELVA